MNHTDETTIGDRYRASRLRVTDLLGSISATDWETQVPACPGWRIRDVLAHLVGVIEDAAAGRIAGPPSPDQTADEVDRHRADDPAQLLRDWSTLAPTFEAAISGGGRWPALIDVLSHEHDIRGALGSRDERSHPDVVRLAQLLTGGLPSGVAVDLDVRPDPDAHDDRTRLRTTSFEFFRLRLGRRSRSQVLQLDWSADPDGVVDDLFVFGPAEVDVVE